MQNVSPPLVHFVGFRDDRIWHAVKVWGRPDMIHPDWDIYAQGDIAAHDMVVFANGEADRKPRSFTREAAAARRRRGK